MPKYYSKEVKEIIINVRNYFQEEKDHQSLTLPFDKVIERTATAVGVSPATVKRVSAEYHTKGKVEQCKPKSGRPRIICDEFLQGVIRRMIFNFYMEKRFPTIKELYIQIKLEVLDLPEFSAGTLYRWLKEMNFSYKKLNNKPILMEHPTIAAQRGDFLLTVQRYRNQGWNIYYTDETWCGANHSKQFGWVEKVNPENRDSFDHYRGGIQEVNGYRGGIKRPSGAGQRVIILHIGSEDGFLQGCLKCFIGEKNKAKADYHHEMNKQHFEEWFRHVLSIIPARSIIVIDQAPYHTMLDPVYRNPTMAWKKSNIIEWLLKENVQRPEGISSFSELTKAQLLQLSKPHHHAKVLLLDSRAQQVRGNEVKLLWLPVAHCEFNAIELIWAYVKNKVAKSNNTFKIKDVLNLCIEAMNTVSKEIWQNCVAHCKKLETIYIEKDHIVDTNIEPTIIINLREDDDDDESLDYNDSSTDNEECDDNDTEIAGGSSNVGGSSGTEQIVQSFGQILGAIQTFAEKTGPFGLAPEPRTSS